jgi:hypothetical protein
MATKPDHLLVAGNDSGIQVRRARFGPASREDRNRAAGIISDNRSNRPLHKHKDFLVTLAATTEPPLAHVLHIARQGTAHRLRPITAHQPHVIARRRPNTTAPPQRPTSARRLPGEAAVSRPTVVAAEAAIPLLAVITAAEGHDLPSAAPAHLTGAGAAFFCAAALALSSAA